ncbi:alpha-1,3/1,6-mannosyltransferase ALG2-like [Amphiura filiformis]|uniref:alpha-1,3/1,6-mannosyltransferase ALG2-like n=1 Tax=Amphiura filiformis TaxID=82378 RepID=UPI003B20DBD6
MPEVVFLHPDLGIGGAERLVVDAAVALKRRGHTVTMVTSHHDPSHCFQETRDGTLDVVAAGDWLPRSIFGKCYALCAYIRMIYTALYLAWASGIEYDVVICDQISACIPFLRWFGRNAKILFYCHFPDQLLTKRQTWLKKIYRAPIDKLEEKTTGMADMVLVNSNFTANTFKETFPSLADVNPEVLYPSLDVSAFDGDVEPAGDLVPNGINTLFLSINRYERKKNLGLAIEALGELKKLVTAEEWKQTHLIMAGGYDDRVTENKEHYMELRHLTDNLKLNDQVSFLRSFSDAQKLTLLDSCTCLLYTPSNEHFGIVPIESMYMKRPVIAVNSGGPLETVKDGATGFLRASTAEDFAEAMTKFVKDAGLSKKMGQGGHRRVISKFSFEAFGSKLDSIVNNFAK